MINSVPTTNSGSAAKMSVPSDDVVSNFLSRLSAAYEPTTIDNGIDATAATAIRKNEYPTRAPRYSATGIRVA